MDIPEVPNKPTEPALPWEPPTIVFLGTISELVKGGGKSSAGNDGDPLGTSKGGGA